MGASVFGTEGVEEGAGSGEVDGCFLVFVFGFCSGFFRYNLSVY